MTTPTPDDASPPDDAAETRRRIDVARAALARARAHARTTGRQGHRSSAPTDATTGSRRWRVTIDPDEEVRSGPGPDARDPQVIGNAIESLVSLRGWHAEVAVAGVLGRWAEIVGPDVAEHVSVESFTPAGQVAAAPDTAAPGPTPGDPAGGELVLRADSTAWATQVRLLLPALRRRLDEELGAGLIGRVRILGPAAPAWRKGALHVRGRGPRDTWG